MAWGPAVYKTALQINAFDGGLNTKLQNTNTPLNQSPDCQNVQFDDYGAVGTNTGYNVFNTAAIATAPIDGIGKYVDYSGDQKLMVACAGSLWYASGTTFVTVAGSEGLYTSAVDVSMINVDDWVYVSNGSVRPYKYDGTNFQTIGVDPTTVLASAVCNASGVLSGTFRYALSGVNTSNVESDVALIVSGITAVGGQVSLGGLYVYPAVSGVDTKYLYRTTAAAGVDSVLWWRVTAVTNAVVTYIDNAYDSDLVTPAPADHGVMPPCKFMTYYRSRVFAAGSTAYPYRLYFSDAGSPEIWPVTNYIDIESGDGKKISGLAAFGNSIVVHKNDGKGQGSIYLIYIGDSSGYTAPDNWYVFKSPSAYSAIANKSLTFFENLLFFLNKDGAYAFSGEDLARTAADAQHGRFLVDSLSFDIEPDIKQLSPSGVARSCAIQYDGKIWLAVPYQSTSGTNNRIYVYDFERLSESVDTKPGAWSYRTAPGINCWIEHDNLLYGGSSDDIGTVYALSATNYNYGGGAIDSYYWTAQIAGHEEHREYTKVWRYLYVTHECPGDWDMTVEYRTDFSDVTTSTTIDLDSGGSEWDSLVWSVGAWDAGVGTKRTRIILVNAVGKFIQFRFRTNTANHHWNVHEIETLYSLRSRR